LAEIQRSQPDLLLLDVIAHRRFACR
jgi:hypothetical protein